ncbi:YhgE/Pip domain-containing protein [Paenibacillus pinistramenti]|uniref:YhgE/Pip domain-containing protein n=1 Tax=Paenibacillus pinistramenti TaxID=1768003 RepID=UPI0011085179|nr:ABC transporter permease [Paenibacillus pinistramenti]
MNVFTVVKDFFKIMQTKIGLVFAFIVPLLFTIIWMTGYDGATGRLDQLRIGIVNADGSQGQAIAEGIGQSVPYKSVNYASLEEARQEMNDGQVSMVISIPENFTADAKSGEGKLTYYINQAASEIATSIMEKSAEQISASVGTNVFKDVHQDAVTADVVKTNGISNFAVSMLPMILGFITYIGVMTMNIQLNLVSMMLKRKYGKWQIFWARQVILLGVALAAPLVVTGVAMLFADPASSFWAMWGYHILVYLACICLTQMTFALFGGLGALVNVALIPFQLMTAGNILPAAMLTPFYRHIGDFLPASNGVRGYLRLIYSGADVSVYVLHLLLIAVVTWGITFLRTALDKQQAQPVASQGKPASAH